MSENDESSELIHFSTAASGYFAIYVPEDANPGQQEQPVLRNVVGWATLRDRSDQTTTVAYVPHPYSDELVRAGSLYGFISLIGPNAQSDHKAGAVRILGEAQAHRNAQLAREANERRRGKSHLPGRRKRAG